MKTPQEVEQIRERYAARVRTWILGDRDALASWQWTARVGKGAGYDPVEYTAARLEAAFPSLRRPAARDVARAIVATEPMAQEGRAP
jgi:hypothetical protein